MTRRVQLKNCRNCGYETPAGQRCAECDYPQDEIEFRAGTLAPEHVGSDTSSILISGVLMGLAPLGIVLTYAVLLFMPNPTDLFEQIGTFAMFGIPALALFMRMRVVFRNGAIVPWWTHVVLIYAASAIASTAGMYSAEYYRGFAGPSRAFDLEVFDFVGQIGPFSLVAAFVLILLIPAYEQWRVALALGTEDDARSARATFSWGCVWGASYLLTAGPMAIAYAPWVRWLTLVWFAAAAALFVIMVFGAVRLQRCASWFEPVGTHGNA
jgi:hypothetical protein